MTKYNPLLLIDFYKSTHAAMYPKGLTRLVSYYTPRVSRLSDTTKITMFGLQGFIHEYLIDGFNNNFFNRPEDEVIAEYERILNHTLGEDTYGGTDRIRNLHRLGYLPLAISAVPEGMRTAVGVPQIEITNTHPDFVWLVNTIETMLSCSMWHTQISAEVGYRYWNIVDKYWRKSCDKSVNPHRLLGDFSMRGQHSVESAIKSSAAWALSFYNTATVPAILWLEDHYKANCEVEDVAYGAISTEHSVMCSNFAIDGDEITHIRRLLTEIYPNKSFSMVSDSYDYWNLVSNILPQLKDEILSHNGTLSIRGDSGDPIEIIAGKDIVYLDNEHFKKYSNHPDEYCWDSSKDYEEEIEQYFWHNGKYYVLNGTAVWGYEQGAWTGSDYPFIESWNAEFKEIEPTPEILGTVETLWNIFGGTVNSKGYKVLDSHIKAIYGDSITPQRCEEIYHRLTNKGFAINNVSLGVGSFSMMCLTENDKYNPYTRDTFGIAVKATYAEDKDGNPIMIHKQPKATDWKKSQCGCCYVYPDGTKYIDQLTFNQRNKNNNLLTSVFKNGGMIKEYSLIEVRDNLFNNYNFELELKVE